MMTGLMYLGFSLFIIVLVQVSPRDVGAMTLGADMTHTRQYISCMTEASCPQSVSCHDLWPQGPSRWRMKYTGTREEKGNVTTQKLF